MKKVCIVVPVYRQKLNSFEKISLRQLLRILKGYPICFIQPDSMKMEYEELAGCEYRIYKFSEAYFQSTATYSDLMLSPFFYERFLEYEYMLIYQLDAFVFSDCLLDFCDMGYDYIGAPQHHDWTDDVVVGNGGLSLRKIESVLDVTKRYYEIVQDSYYKDFFRKWEDNFFSYCGKKEDVKFTVPDISLACAFSVVMDIENGIRNIPVKGLPFGTHAWHRLNYEFWKNIIGAYGYGTDHLIAERNIDTLETDRRERYRKYLIEIFSGFPTEKKRGILEELGILPDQKYVMWGAGGFGKRSLCILQALELNVSVIFDSKPREESLYGIAVKKPDYEEIRENKSAVLISSEDFEDEIEYGLIRNGCKNLIKLSSVLQERREGIREKYLGSEPEIEGVTVPFRFLTDHGWIADVVRKACGSDLYCI